MVKRALDDDACHVGVRAIATRTRGAARAAYPGLRVFVGYFGRVDLVKVHRRFLGFDLYFNVVDEYWPFLYFLYRLLCRFFVFRGFLLFVEFVVASSFCILAGMGRLGWGS